MAQFPADSARTEQLLAQARAGDRRAFDELFAMHRSYLHRLIELRMDPKLRPRVDPSDVVQEAQLEAFRRIDGYLQRPQMPFRLWLRQIVHDRLLKIRRHHVDTLRRSLDREVAFSDRSSLLLARELAAVQSTPSQHLSRKELIARIHQSLAKLSENDREILMLRNFEALSYDEVGYVLGIDPVTARKRHGRAIIRLHKILFEGGLTDSQP